MRSNLLGMCSVVAAVAVAGSASAGVIDSFAQGFVGAAAPGGTLASTGSATSSDWSTLGSASDLFAYRIGRAQANSGGQVSASIGAGGWTTNFGSKSLNTQLWYQMVDSTSGTTMNSGPVVDLSNLATISFTVSGVTSGTAAYVSLGWRDNANKIADWTSGGGVTVIGNGNHTVVVDWDEFKESTGNLTFDSSKITRMTLTAFRANGSATTSGDITISNFTYSMIPAPGAVALLGAAGLVGTRRRKA